ncbi:MAG: zf-TFIIB domain-containing protein [Rickettsiales bacterium]
MTAIHCPICQAPFKEVAREGVLIDVCTQCRGVWLDNGELEKLMDIAREEINKPRKIGRRSDSGRSRIESWLEPL